MTATRADIVAAVRAAFAERDPDRALGILDRYGSEPWERERERVQLAILELAAGDEDKLRYFTDIAKTDYRDVLDWQASGPLPPAEGEAQQQKARELIRRWGKP
jgi:hypothetical protein